jgi:predicted P-loop ATPase
MTFDIREHLDSLTKSPRAGKYICPVCNGNALSVSKKNGAYRCFSGECESALIRAAIAPLPEDVTVTDYGKKQKTAPKPKAQPVFVDKEPTWQALGNDITFPEKVEQNRSVVTNYNYGNGHTVKRVDHYKLDERGKKAPTSYKKDVLPFHDGEMGKGDRPWEAYRLNEVLDHCVQGQWVFGVEGEKTVEAARFIGLPTITWQGGSWTDAAIGETIITLKSAGCGGILYLPDHDEAGYRKGEKVCEIAASHSFPCLLLNPLDVWRGMPERGDLADWVKEYHGIDMGENFYVESIEMAIAEAMARQKPSKTEYYMELILAESDEAAEAVKEKYKEKLETAQRIVAKNDPEAAAAIAKTSEPLEPYRPETRRIHGGYKDLKVVELYEFVEEYLGDRLSFDDLRSEVLLDGEPMKFGHDLKFWFFHQFGESAAKEDIYSCLLYKAKMNSFNPVQKYLEQVHQGTARIDIDSIASRYFGTTDPIYDRMVKMWLISAVARVYDAGCQVDHTLILQSGQGKYKSTWFKTLGGEWFSDSVKDIENKDSLLTMHSSWIIELSELDRITSKKQAGIIKHFLTQREDTFRKPYGKEVERNPRRALFCGTVNPSRFLVDSENRRFWIIPVADSIREINIPLLEKERDGIWAAAVDALHAGDTWYPSDDEKAAIAELSKEFLDQDVWLEPIEEYCSGKPWVSVFEILCDLFKMGKSEMDRRSEMRVAKILDHLGWTKQTRKEIHGSFRRVRLNPTWNEPEARYFADNTNTNLFNNTNGKVGNVGKSIDTQSLETYQPTDQPSLEVGKNGGRIDPTSEKGVGQPQTQTGQAIYQPADLSIPIPEKYSRAGFEYAVGDRAYLKNSNLILTIKDFPPVGVQFMRQEYLCVDPHGAEEWIPQKDLIPAKEKSKA